MKYELIFHVLQAQLVTVLQVLSPEVSLVSLRQIGEDLPAAARRRKPNAHKPRGDKTIKELMIDLFERKAKWSVEELKHELVTAGFSATSISPAMSQERREGRVTWNGSTHSYMRMK